MADKITRAIKPDAPATATAIPEGAAQTAAPRFLGNEKVVGHTDSYPLRFPMEFAGSEYRTVTFRRPKGKSFKKMRRLIAMGVDVEDAMLAIVTDLPIEMVDEMDGEDFIEVSQRAKPFIPARFLPSETDDEESGPDSPTGQNTPA